MKFSKIQIFNLCLLLSVGAQAQETDSKGGLFVEPFVSYEMNETSIKYPSFLSDSSGEANGFGIGARLGFHINEAFFVAIDGRYAMPDYKDSSVNYSAKAVSTSLAPTVGLQMPDLGLRIWGSYVMGGELDPEESGGFDVKYTDNKGYRVGVGFRISSFSLNLEYQQTNYDGATLQKLGSFAPGTTFEDVDHENKGWIASVSFPLEL